MKLTRYLLSILLRDLCEPIPVSPPFVVRRCITAQEIYSLEHLKGLFLLFLIVNAQNRFRRAANICRMHYDLIASWGGLDVVVLEYSVVNSHTSKLSKLHFCTTTTYILAYSAVEINSEGIIAQTQHVPSLS